MSLFATQHPWFALAVKHHHEKAVARALDSKGFPQFLPLYQSQHRSGGRMQPVSLPLFPSYVFSSFDPARRLPILTIPGVGSIIAIGRNPAPIPVEELESVERMIRSALPVVPFPFLQSGDPVYIEHGPLRGLEGTLVTCKGQYRLVVSVNLLQRAVCTEIDRQWVRPVVVTQPNVMHVEHRAA
jgi:transcription antitermination factor NusG